jgi:hypothetical protein
MTYNPDAEAEHAPEVAATDARQGRWGRHALWMLLASLALVVIALFGTWWARSGDLQSVDHKSRAVAGEEATSPTPLVQPKNKVTDVRPTDLNR